MPTISFSYNNTLIPQTGGTILVQVTYGGLDVNSNINTPFSSIKGCTIIEQQPYGKTVKEYEVTIPATEYERQVPLIFSCFDSNGVSETGVIVLEQGGATNDNEEYVAIDKRMDVFPATLSGQYVDLTITSASPNRETQVTLTDVNGYPVTYRCEVDLVDKVETTNMDVRERYMVRVPVNTIAEPLVTIVTFTAYDLFNNAHTATYTVIQEAANITEYTGTTPYIQPYTTNLQLDAQGNNTTIYGMNYFRVAFYNFISITAARVLGNWLTITSTTQQALSDGGTLVTYYFSALPTTTNRIARITVSGVGNNEQIYSHFINVEQKVEETPPITTEDYTGPIWKDVEYGWETEEVDYTLWSDDKLLFKGRAYRRPNSFVNSILVNRICQNYIATPDFTPEKNMGVYGGYKEFQLKDEDGTNTYSTYAFINDWSYSKDFATGVLSHPILNKQYAVRGQYLPFSAFADKTQMAVEYGIHYNSQTTLPDWTNTKYVTNGVYHDWFIRAKINSELVDDVYIGDKTIEFVDPCKARFVVYYVNPWGGYDWFPIEGNWGMEDNLRSYNYVKNYNNTTYEFGDCKYLAEIDRHYTLTTGWLKQEESNRMWYMLESTKVYLHDIVEDKLMPVIVVDNTITHKRKNRNNKIIQYTFDVKLSQQMERA